MEFDPHAGRSPQLEAPTIAVLAQMINDRPSWQTEEPLPVDGETFEAARREMREALKAQGRPLATAPWIKSENFLLRGIPVVIDDSQD